MKQVPWRNKTEKDGGLRPSTALQRLQREMDEMFGVFFNTDIGEPFGLSTRGFGPKVDLTESDHDVIVNMDLPGIDPKQLEINVHGNVLSIRGERKSDREEKGRDFHFVERQYGSFQRDIPLPTVVENSNVAANYKNGVLTITLPKDPVARPRKIAIKSE
jgi:HSP20 family protein